MKLLNFISCLLLLIGMVSCSNEAPNTTALDPIVGTWKPIREAVFIVDGMQEVFEKTPCEQTSRFIFETNGNFNYTEFTDEAGDCLPDESYIEDGSWDKLAQEKYKFNFTYYNSNTQLSESDSQIPDKVQFFDENNTMRIIELVEQGEKYIELVRIN